MWTVDDIAAAESKAYDAQKQSGCVFTERNLENFSLLLWIVVHASWCIAGNTTGGDDEVLWSNAVVQQ